MANSNWARRAFDPFRESVKSAAEQVQLIDVTLRMPRDWKKFHADNVAKLDPAKRQAAVEFLRENLADIADEIQTAIAKDPQGWWVPQHFGWLMAVRNGLRTAGFSEKDLGVDNLDDYCVGLVELAMEPPVNCSEIPNSSAMPSCQPKADIPPVDRSACVLTDGSPVTPDHTEIQADGQQKGYVVLEAKERAKGFVRPVRRTYTHIGRPADMVNHTSGMEWKQRIGGCGTDTTMGLVLAETYARCPDFYSGTFCVFCGVHRPLNEFVWKGTTEQVGS